MANRFKLSMQPNWGWRAEDAENNIVMTFREGLVNDTQDVKTPSYTSRDEVMRVPTLLSEMGDWLAVNHPMILRCNPAARCNAIELLGKEDFWVVLADALQTAETICTAQYLAMELTDYLRETPCELLSYDDKQTMIATIGGMSDDEATEVARIIRAYWQYRYDSQPIDEWARDVLWWAAFCPMELREGNMEVDDDGDIY